MKREKDWIDKILAGIEKLSFGFFTVVFGASVIYFVIDGILS